jgi:hypothetical protein
MYKLTKKEIIELDNYWKFINIFKIHGKDTLYLKYLKKIKDVSWLDNSVSNYRKYIIEEIRKRYNIEQFYLYEKMSNKLLHNLLEHIDFNIDNIYIKDKVIKIYKIINDEKELKGSFSHKLYITDLKKNISYTFFDYKNINKIDIITKIFTIMSERKLYEKVMKDELYLEDIICKSSYYPFDYPFPNVNLIFYNKNNKKYWIDRIKKLYYNNYIKSPLCNNIYDKGWYSFHYGD